MVSVNSRNLESPGSVTHLWGITLILLIDGEDILIVGGAIAWAGNSELYTWAMHSGLYALLSSGWGCNLPAPAALTQGEELHPELWAVSTSFLFKFLCQSVLSQEEKKTILVGRTAQRLLCLWGLNSATFYKLKRCRASLHI